MARAKRLHAPLVRTIRPRRPRGQCGPRSCRRWRAPSGRLRSRSTSHALRWVGPKGRDGSRARPNLSPPGPRRMARKVQSCRAPEVAPFGPFIRRTRGRRRAPVYTRGNAAAQAVVQDILVDLRLCSFPADVSLRTRSEQDANSDSQHATGGGTRASDGRPRCGRRRALQRRAEWRPKPTSKMKGIDRRCRSTTA